MSEYIIQDTTLTAIGDAIREKAGTSDSMTPAEMATAISEIETGGEALTSLDLYKDSNATQLLGYDNFNTLLDGKKFTINALTTWYISGAKNTTSYFNGLFYYCCNLKDLSQVVINIPVGITRINSMFYYNYLLENLPTINFDDGAYLFEAQNLFCDCRSLKTIPDEFLNSVLNKITNASLSNNIYINQMFMDCHNLRKAPDLSTLNERWFSTNGLRYVFYGCTCIPEVIGFPCNNGTLTSNALGYSPVGNCNMLKRFTFATDNGTPYVRKWTNQTLDVSSSVGYGTSTFLNRVNDLNTDFNLVSDDTTYAEYKDSNYYTTLLEYSRYNHDSAVETINSLPDTSAYLETQGGTNTIKFKSNSGSLTDGGAISTLTEDEIAVATAKGWTVSLV